MPFHDAYVVRAGDTLTSIARTYNYSNPGPIVAYPPNQALFPSNATATPNQLRAGSTIYIPWPADLLRRLIERSRSLTHMINRDALQLIQRVNDQQSNLDSFMTLLDMANFIATLNVGLVMGGVDLVRGAGNVAEHVPEPTTAQAIMQMLENRAGNVSNAVSTLLPAPAAPTMNFRYFARHALGPLNPSYWGSVGAAISEGDPEIWMYGSAIVTYRQVSRITNQANRDIERLKDRIREMQTQMNAPFNSARI